MKDSEKLVKDIKKLELMAKLKKTMDDWCEIYKRDRKVSENNFEEVVKGAKEIISYLKNLEEMCILSNQELDNKILDWVREKTPQYQSLVFEMETIWKKMSRLNDELLLFRVDNEKGKGCLFVIFEDSKDKKEARQQLCLLKSFSYILSTFTNENGDCDTSLLFDSLRKTSLSSSIVLTYAFVPEGNEKAARELLVNALASLTAEKLNELHFSRRDEKKEQEISTFRNNVEIVEKFSNIFLGATSGLLSLVTLTRMITKNNGKEKQKIENKEISNPKKKLKRSKKRLNKKVYLESPMDNIFEKSSGKKLSKLIEERGKEAKEIKTKLKTKER